MPCVLAGCTQFFQVMNLNNAGCVVLESPYMHSTHMQALPAEGGYAGAGWKNANIAFMRGGGYSVSKDIPNIQQDTIIYWGADDEILDKENVKRFAQDLPHSR